METTPRILTSNGQEDLAPGIRWTGRTRGGYFGNWFFVQLIRCFGVWPAYLWLVLVAAYFTLANSAACRASAEYWEHLFGPLAWWRRPLLVYRHFLAHGVTLIDRLAVLMGRSRIECVFDGEDLFKPHLEQHRGIILVGAHVGCWELGGHFLGRFDIPVNLVVIEREAAGIQKLMDSATGGRRFRILTADDNPLRSVPILAALRRGEIVALLGDRSFGGTDVEVSFLGGKVRLPVGPYHLAAASGAPVFQVFVVREKLGRYRFVAFPPEFVSREEIRSNRDAVQTHVRNYAERLEAFVRQYPFQWANFFPVLGSSIREPMRGRTNAQRIARTTRLLVNTTPSPISRRRVAGFTQPAPQPYLEETCVIPIRFHEVDSMLVVWHGHYVAYIEEARRALGRRYGVDYTTFFAHNTPAPVAQLHVDYLASARLADMLTVTARLFKSEAAKLEFEYEIRRQNDRSLLAFGTSLQVFTNLKGELLLTMPLFMVERYRAWEKLWIQP